MKTGKKIILVLLLVLILLLSSDSIAANLGIAGHEKVLSRNVRIGETPVIEIYEETGEKMPLVILQHGFKNKKESVEELGKRLAENGFFVVAPDAYAHGERKEDPLSLVEIIVKTSEEYDKIIDFYETDKRTDASKLGIAGFSMGGCICFYYGTYGEHKPDVMAPTITTPYFEQFIGHNLGRSIYSSEKGVRLETDENELERLNKYIRESSPFKDYVNLEGVDMIIQNGGADNYVTDEGVRKLEKVLDTENADVRFITIEGAKHQVTAEMKGNITEFMKKNLK